MKSFVFTHYPWNAFYALLVKLQIDNTTRLQNPRQTTQAQSW